MRRFFTRLCVLVTFIATSSAFAAPPSTALFEGMLTSSGGGAAADGEYELTFNIYGAPSGGSALWSEGPVKVKVSGGLFSYALGTSKPLDAVKLAAAPQQWVAVKVANDPELPRVQMHASVYALHAGKASGLMCSGCVSVSAMKFDGDVDLSGFSIKAKNGIFTGDLVAGSFAGDGSKLTGIKMPTGECKNAGEVVKGINADGSLKCVKGGAGALPIDGLNEISNDVLTNQFVETMGAPSKKVPIPDNQGVDAVSNIDYPSIGIAQSLDVVVSLENTDLASVSAYLLPPDDKKTGWVLCDPCGKKDEKKYTATFNAKNPPKTQAGSGLKIDQWVGKNPKGLWTLKVKDVAFCIPQQAGNAVYCNTTAKTDGWISDWSVKMQYVSNNKVATNGSQEISKDLKVGANLTVTGDLMVKGKVDFQAAQPWNAMFPKGSRPVLFGYFEDRLNNSYQYDYKYDRAYQVPTDSVNSHRALRNVMWADYRGNIRVSRGGDNYGNGSNDQSMAYMMVFVKNTTDKDISHKVCYYYSSRGTYSNHGGIAINGKDVYTQGGNTLGTNCSTMTFPKKTSSAVSLKSGSYHWTTWNGYWTRIIIGFYSDTWNLPSGLEWDYERYYKWTIGAP